MTISTHLASPGKIAAAIFVVVGLMSGAASHAATIAIENPSFEANSLGNGGFTLAAPIGWTALNGTSAGTFNPTSDQLPAPTDGLNVAYLNAPTGIRQTLTTHVAAGSYTLTADFAYRHDCCGKPGFTMDLLGGSNVLASFIGNPADFSSTSFKTAVLNINVPNGASDIGSALSIRFVIVGANGGEQLDLDNVTLNFTAPSAVPLPASAWLLMPAMAGLAGFARRKARS